MHISYDLALRSDREAAAALGHYNARITAATRRRHKPEVLMFHDAPALVARGDPAATAARVRAGVDTTYFRSIASLITAARVTLASNPSGAGWIRARMLEAPTT